MESSPVRPEVIARSGSPTFWMVLCFACLALVWAGCGSRAGDRQSSEANGGLAEGPAKNVLILSVDTLRYDALGFSGEPGSTETPTLDALASRGVTFSNAVAPMPRTTPSLGSLLTGLWPQHHGSREVGDPIFSEVTTLAEILREKGFSTLGVSVNDSAGEKQGLARGFDSFVSYRDLLATYGDELYYELSPASPMATGWAEATNEQLLGLVESLDPKKPYFGWVFYFDPHFVYRPPAPWQDAVDATECWQLYDHYSTRLHLGGEIFSDIGGVASKALDDCRRLYDAEVRYTDHVIGQLLKALEDRGLLDETLVVFTADHGENFGEAGLYFEHGDNAHGAGLRVPLVFSGPGVASGVVEPTAVSLVDVAPTVLEWLAVESDLVVDGESLAERLSGDQPSSPDRIVFAESASALLNEAPQPLITGRLGGRVCVNHEQSTLCREAETVTFFDRSTDPRLQRDLRGTDPELEARLLAALDRWPAESARERVARTARFKLVQFPRFEGGYRSELYDLTAEGEGVDIGAQYPRVLEVLEEALSDWSEGIPREVQRQADDEREQTLRNLGYIR